MKNPLLPLLVAFLLFCAFSGCNGQQPEEEAGSAFPTRRDLYRSFREQNRMLLVYGSQNEAFLPRYRRLAEEMQKRIDRFELLVKSDKEVSQEELSSYPLLLLGTPLSNEVILGLSPQLPVAFDGFCLRFGEREFTDEGTVFCLSFFPNPLNPRLPLSLVTGLADTALCDFFGEKWTDMSWGGWHYELYECGRRRIMGNFSDKGGNAWVVDPSALFDLDSQPSAFYERPHYRFEVHGTLQEDSLLPPFMDTLEARSRQIEAFFSTSLPRIKHHVYASAELKGLMVNQTEPCHVDFSRGEVHSVLSPPFSGATTGSESEWWIRRQLGQPQVVALEKGLSMTFSRNWHKRGYLYWALRLYRSGNAVALSELLDNAQFERESSLVMPALAGSFVEFLIQHWGKDTLLARYANWQPAPREIRGLEKAWHEWMDAQPPVDVIERPAMAKPMLKGFNFTHEGYQIYNGYLSRRARESLAYTAGVGANAVAVVPYTGMGDPHKPVWLRFSRSPGGENDESVIHSLHAARQQGMRTVLKPQVWLWQGSWPGAVEMRSEADWQLFFDYYYRWIRHYALLAEMEDVDVFCVGVEFQEATLQREADWRKIFRKLRPLFSGKLTYSANWGKEFEGVGFWDELDYISINCYYPLSKEEAPSLEELEQSCRKVMEKVARVSRRYGKPVLFTEIGFRSVEGPWKNPHAEPGGRAFNGQHQALAYQAVCNTLKNQDWCKGVFWWNWGTDLHNYGEADRSFCPFGKEAEAVVRGFYRGR